MEQVLDGEYTHVVLGETMQGLVHDLSNRFAVAQSVTQRLKGELARVVVEQVPDDLAVLASAIQGCSETIGRMQALLHGDILVEGGARRR